MYSTKIEVPQLAAPAPHVIVQILKMRLQMRNPFNDYQPNFSLISSLVGITLSAPFLTVIMDAH